MPWVGFVPSQKREKNAPPLFLVGTTNPKRRDVVRLSWPLSRVASGRALKVRFFAFALSFSSSSSSSSQMSSFFKSFVVSSVARVRGTPYVATFREKCPQKKRYLSPTRFSLLRARRDQQRLSLSLSLSRGIIEKPRGWWWWWWWSFLSVETRARALLRPDSMRMYIIMGQKRERGTLSNCLSFSSIFGWTKDAREKNNTQNTIWSGGSLSLVFISLFFNEFRLRDLSSFFLRFFSLLFLPKK